MDIENKLVKLEKALQKARDENTSLRKIKRDLFRNETLADSIIKTLMAQMAKLKPLKSVSRIYAGQLPQQKWGNIAGISDWHIGEEVNAVQLNNTNTFNYKIGEKRIESYIAQIDQVRIKSNNLIIADLGDNIRGVIHGGLKDTEDGLMTSLVKCVDLTQKFIVSMLERYDHIEYRFVVGNHSRLDDYIQSKDKYKDYSWLVVQMLIRMFADNPRINFVLSETGYHLLNLNSTKVMLFHGDTVRWYKPYSDTARGQLQDICVGMFKQPAKHFFSGHIHKASTNANQYGGLNIVSGTLVGSNEYGVQNGFNQIYPSQCFFNINLKGDIDEVYHFKL